MPISRKDRRPLKGLGVTIRTSIAARARVLYVCGVLFILASVVSGVATATSEESRGLLREGWNRVLTGVGLSQERIIKAPPVRAALSAIGVGMPPGPTTTTLASSPNPSFTGTSVLFTATVTDNFLSSPVTLGTVTFKEGATVLASNVPLSGGVFTFSTSALTEGSHVITAEYSGDIGLYNPSNGSTTQVVNNQTVVTGNQYCNPGAITIPDSGAGTPYPSNIFVSGLINPITKVTLSLNGFSHAYPNDLDLLLVGPAGQKFVFMGNAGGISPVTNLALTFDDAAVSLVPSGGISSGTYRPTNTFATAGNFPAPAPASPYQRPAPIGAATFASVFNGASANGTWKLFVWDVVAGQAGSINGGWCLGITTQKSDTTVSASTSPNPSLPGQQTTVSGTVNVVPPGTGTPTGTIEFRDQTAALLCSATLPATSCNHAFTTAGSKFITATYSGDANFNGSTSTPYTHTVNSALTTLSITNAAFIASNPSFVGQQLVVNWNVSVTPPATTGPGFAGNVQVQNTSGSSTCTAPVSAGTCTLSPFTTSGPTMITAYYLGNPSYQQSSDMVAHTVNLNPTQTTITNAATLSSTPSVVGQPYAVDVSVTQALLLPDDFATSSVSIPVGPTGSVQVSDGAGGICLITLPGTSCNLVSPTTGLKTITAVYSGDMMFGGSNAPNASHTVNKADTSLTSLTDSPDPSFVGQPYTVGFTLNVTAPGSSSPTAPSGTVSVSDGAGGSCIATLPASSCQLTSTVQGPKTLTFTYNGDTNFNTSTSTAGHAVNKADTTVAITNDTPDPSVIGQYYAVTASVSVNSPGSGTPTGSITVTDGTNSCTITLPSASCNLPSTSVGAKTLTATYSGDGNYNGSGPSAGVPHQVNKADVVVVITSDNPDPSAQGQNVTVRVSFTPASPGYGEPTGNVTITVSGGSETCTGSLAAASGSCTLALTVPGSRTLTATYNGDTNFNTGTDTEPHTVVAPPSITKSFSPASVPVGLTSQLTITITNPAVNTVALTGVGFTDVFPNAPNLIVANPTGAILGSCGGATLTDNGGGALAPGDLGIMLTGATVGVGSSCTVKVNVTPQAAGPFLNVTTNVSSTNGGTGNTATATLSTNTPPTITSETRSVKAGSAPTAFNIGTAVDPDQAVNTLGITINGNPTTASSNGVTVSGVAIGAGGAVTAIVSTTCAATTATFNLVVTDNASAQGNGTLTVSITANTAPVMGYANQVVTAGTTPSYLPTSGPSDNGTFVIGSVAVSPNNGGLGVMLNQSNGQVTILNALLIGSYTVSVPVTDNCGALNPATFTVTVVCPTITVSPVSLPSATLNVAYGQTITASPAGGNYSFSVTSGLLPAGLTLNSNGSFSGAATQSGFFNFRVTASGFGGCTAYRDYSLTVVCPTVTVSPASLPNGTVGTGYSQTVSASPAGSYNYAVTSGSLPVGLTLNPSTGAITGTPTLTGIYNFTITTAIGGCSGSNSYTVTIECPSITLSPASLPNGEAGVAYSQSLSVSPAGSYTYSLIQGSLPPGMALNPTTGLLSGLAMAKGTHQFIVRALGAGGCSGMQSYTLEIVCPTIQVNPSVALPGGTRGTFYSQTFTALPAGGGYLFSVTMGAMPTGLSLNSATGVMSGTPTTIGTFTFRIAASGFGGCTNFRDYTVVISGGTCPTVTLASIPATATVGVPYVSSTTGSPAAAYSYQVTLGSLPPGVTLYGSFGLLFGYPTVAGPYNFTVTATDTSGCTGSRAYSIVVGSSLAFSSQAGVPMVVSAASYRPDSATPGGIMAAFGESIASEVEAASTIPLPTELGGTQVFLRDSAGVDHAAPLLFVSAKQINFVIPEDVTLGEATVTFTSNTGVIGSVTTVIERVAPGLFGANGDGGGAAAGYFLRVRGDASQIEEPAAVVDRVNGIKVAAAVAIGDETETLYLVLSGTGLRGRSGISEVIVRVGGEPAEVTYVGAQGSFVGLDQMNIRIPRALAGRGEVEIEVLIDGRPANILRVHIE